MGKRAILLAVAVALAAAPGATSATSAGGGAVPVLLAPHDRTLAKGHPVTFRVRDANANAPRYPPFLDVTNRRPRRGVLPVQTAATGGTFLRLRRTRTGQYAAAAKVVHIPGFWLLTHGRYYVQVRQYDPAAPGDFRYSGIATVFVR